MRLTLKQLTHSEMVNMRGALKGWEYPKHDLSPFLKFMDKPKRIAINLYGWIAIAMFVSGPILAWYLESFWWLVVTLVSLVVWSSNRRSMEQFFIEKLESDPMFFEFVKRSNLGQHVVAVFEDRK